MAETITSVSSILIRCRKQQQVDQRDIECLGRVVQQKERVSSVEGVVDSDEELQVNLRSGESNEQSGCEYGVSDFTENYDDNFDESHSLLGDFFVARPDIDDVYEMHFEEDVSDVFDSERESQSQQQLEVDTTTVQLFPQCPLSLDASELRNSK